MAEREERKNQGVRIGGARDVGVGRGRVASRSVEDREDLVVPAKRRPPSQRHEEKDVTNEWEEMKES